MGSDCVEAINAISGERCSPHPHNFTDRLIRPGDQAFFDIIQSFMGYRTCYYRTFNVGTRDAGAAHRVPEGARMDGPRDRPAEARRDDRPDRARRFPRPSDIGFASEMDAFGLNFCHGLGLGLHERPLISRLNSLKEPIELKAGHGVRRRDLLPGDRRHLGGAHRGGGDPDAERPADHLAVSGRGTADRQPVSRRKMTRMMLLPVMGRVARLTWALLIVSIACGALPAFGQTTETDQANAIFAEFWERFAREFPEYATFRGDNRYNDRLTDWSQDAIARRHAYAQDVLARLRQIDANRLSGQDRVSLEVLRTRLDQRLRVEAFAGSEWMPVSQMGGPQLDFALLVKSTPFRTASDYDKYLLRLAALPTQLRQLEALMRRGLATGWVLPAEAIVRVPSQIDAWLAPDVTANPAGRPFVDIPAGIPEAARTRLTAEGKRAIAEDVVPAFRALKTFFEATYLPGARKELGASTLPGGAAYYDALIAEQTTTAMSARDIHALGLREVSRIEAAMTDVVRKTGFKGTRDGVFPVRAGFAAVLLHARRRPARRIPRHRQTGGCRAAEAFRGAAAAALRHTRDGGVRGRQCRPLHAGQRGRRARRVLRSEHE